MMTFVGYDANAVDIKEAWMATNATKEVDIIHNINDEFELWIGSQFIQQYEDFETARRYAEFLVPFTVKWG
jgi:hypothetical protein